MTRWFVRWNEPIGPTKFAPCSPLDVLCFAQGGSMSWFCAMATSQEFWDELFPGGDAQGQGIGLVMRLLRKRGRPFFLLPGAGGPAAECLSLYPAQTGRARLARRLMRWALRGSWFFGAQRVNL